jgi:hypothetical protein
MSVNHLLFDSLWPGLAVWGALYVSDYAFTLTCARLYQNGVKERIVFEGSFEITPYFQADIDSLRVVSPRFLAAMAAACASLGATWWLAGISDARLYQFVLGSMILSELAIHVRHVRNLFLFRAILGTDDIQGRMHYARPSMLRMSAVELFAFAGMYAFLFLFTFSWFVFGGVFACLGIAMKHRSLAEKHSAALMAKTAAVQKSEQAPASESTSS